MISILEKLGLSEKEAKVYLAALELGADSVQNIAKKSGVNRVTTYVILESLAQMGLASSYEKGKKTFFTAENPEQLDRLLKLQEEEIEEKRKDLSKSIPELQAIFNLADSKPKVKFYDGKEGVIAMQNDLFFRAKPNSATYSFTALDNLYNSFPNFNQEQLKNRVSKKIKAYVIYTHKNGPVAHATNKKELRTARFVPKNKFPFNSTITIYPNQKIQISNYLNGFTGVIIEHQDIANTFKAIFDLAWETAEKYNK